MMSSSIHALTTQHDFSGNSLLANPSSASSRLKNLISNGVPAIVIDVFEVI
jgi:hypothetical protein